MKILELVAVKKRSEVEQARADYLSILGRRHDPKSQDGDRLYEIQQLLGITDSQIEEDAIALDEAQKIAGPGSADPRSVVEQALAAATREIDDARIAGEKAEPKIVKMFQAAEQFRDGFRLRIQAATTKFNQASQKADAIDRLILNREYLFGGPWPELTKQKTEQDTLIARYASRGHPDHIARVMAQEDIRRRDWTPPEQTFGGFPIAKKLSPDEEVLAEGETPLNA